MASFSVASTVAMGADHKRSPYRGFSPSRDTPTRSSQYHGLPNGSNISPNRMSRSQKRFGLVGEDDSHAYVNSAVQTEACFPAKTFAGIGEHYQHLASEQLKNLNQFRNLIQCGVAELAGTAYDIVAYKDVMLKMEEQFRTGLPLTDLLVLSSKLFRHTSELARQLNCFFGVVFAEDYSDEHFHFTELRIALRELAEAKTALADAQQERDKLRLMLDEVAVVSMQQTKTVEMLEHRNQAVSQHKTALEDQLAILFHQVADAFKDRCESDLSSINNGLGSLERPQTGRTSVNEAMEAVTQQLQSSRSALSDMKDALFGKGDIGLLAPVNATKNAKGKSGSVQFADRGKRGNDPHDASGEVSQLRLQFKTLETSLTQLVGRLSSIKEEVAASAFETQAAMNERKRSLYMSLQHIRLYEVQNAKLRYSRALFQNTRRHWMELLPRIEKTIGTRTSTLIDPLGNIVSDEGMVVHRLSGGGGSDSALPAAGRGLRPVASAFDSATKVPAKKNATEQIAVKPQPTTQLTGPESPKLGVTPFTSTKEMLLHLHEVGDLLQQMELTFDTDEEHKAFLQLISLAVPTSGRGDISTDSALRRFSNAALEKSLHPSEKSKAAASGSGAAAKGLQGAGGGGSAGANHDGRISPSDAARDPTFANNRGESTHENNQAMQAKFQEQLHDMHAEFAVKLELLRQVYEGRIAELEIKESSFQRQLEELQKLLTSDSTLSIPSPPRDDRNDTTTATTTTAAAAKERATSSLPRKLKGKKGTVGNLQALKSAETATTSGKKDSSGGKVLNDRDAVSTARRDWEGAAADGSLEAQSVSKFDVVSYTDEIDKAGTAPV